MAAVNKFSPEHIPAWPVIIGGAAVEAFAAVALFPQYLPENPFVYTFIRCLGFNVFLYLFYLIEVWPRMLSPLRHLPRPKVSYSTL